MIFLMRLDVKNFLSFGQNVVDIGDWVKKPLLIEGQGGWLGIQIK